MLEAQSPITDVEVADLRQVDVGGDARELIKSGSLRRWMAVRNTTFSGAQALGLVLVLDAAPGKRELEALLVLKLLVIDLSDHSFDLCKRRRERSRVYMRRSLARMSRMRSSSSSK